jgi:hypothetical protein
MSEPEVVIRLDAGRAVFEPGEVLAGEYRLEGCADHAVESVTLVVQWHTTGKGDEDRAIVCEHALEPGTTGRFSVRLPRAPLSYDGFLVQIRWDLRVTARIAGWRDRVAEHRFQLGHVERAEEPAP